MLPFLSTSHGEIFVISAGHYIQVRHDKVIPSSPLRASLKAIDPEQTGRNPSSAGRRNTRFLGLPSALARLVQGAGAPQAPEPTCICNLLSGTLPSMFLP